MLRLAPPPASLHASPPSPPEQLDALPNAELARAVGEHWPVELADRVLAVRGRRAAREARSCRGRAHRYTRCQVGRSTAI